METIHQRIRRVRKERKLTQIQLAEAAHLRQDHISDIEHGQDCAASALPGLAAGLHTTTDYLLTGEGDATEAELLAVYRQLNTAGREHVIANARGLHSQHAYRAAVAKKAAEGFQDRLEREMRLRAAGTRPKAKPSASAKGQKQHEPDRT